MTFEGRYQVISKLYLQGIATIRQQSTTSILPELYLPVPRSEMNHCQHDSCLIRHVRLPSMP